MDEIDRVLASKGIYAAAHIDVEHSQPRRRLAVVTCMDARIDVLAALGLQLGDAHMLRNAGGRVTDDVLRSLALSTHMLGVDTVVVMHHTHCGLHGVTEDGLRQLTGAPFVFGVIDDHAVALDEDLARITAAPYLTNVVAAAGLVFDIATGTLDLVARWNRAI